MIHQLAENQLFHGPLLSLVVWAENTKIATLQEIEDGAVDITFWIEKLFSSLPQETHYSVARTIGTYISHLRDENQRRRLKQSLDTIINDDSVIEGIRDFAKVSREGAKAPGTVEFNMHWICNLLRP